MVLVGFGVDYWVDYDNDEDPLPFRRRVFPSSLDGEHTIGKIVKTLIDSKLFDILYDGDAVSLCCVGILQLMFIGVEDRRIVPDWILKLANDRGGWDNRYPRAAAWSKQGRFLRSMVIDFFHGNLPVARLTPDDTEARYDWWVSSRAYFDGFINQAERVPCFLNRQNMFEVSLDFYRYFEQQKSDLEQQQKDFEEMRKKDAEQEKCMNKCVNLWRTQANNWFLNMGTPTNWQTPMPSQPGSSNWQSQMTAQSATPFMQPVILLHPGTYNWQIQIPSHMGNPNSQTPTERHPDAAYWTRIYRIEERGNNVPTCIGELHT
nr:hypothetical protein [Tanacetum cinerariifolium]